MRLTQLFLEDKQTGHNVGVFIQLPEILAKKFPRLSEDASPSHVTVLYLGDQPISKQNDIAEAVRKIAKESESFELEFGDLSHFHHDDDDKDYEKVAIMRVKSEGLRKLRTALETAMKEHKITFTNKWGSFKPHVTLAYLSAGEEYSGRPISGTWKCTEIKVWGFDKKYTFKLKTTD